MHYIAYCKEASPFLPFVEDPTITPSDEIIDQHLLAVFVASFKNDVQGNFLPETLKYPPTNEMMLKVPPTMREWRKDCTQSTTIITPTPTAAAYCNPQVSTVISDKPVDEDEIIVFSFQKKDTSEDVSVMIEPPLSSVSTLADVMQEGGIFKEFDIDSTADDLMSTPSAKTSDSTTKFRIKKKNGSFYTFVWEKIKFMTVGSIVRIKNVHDDYLIVV